MSHAEQVKTVTLSYKKSEGEENMCIEILIHGKYVDNKAGDLIQHISHVENVREHCHVLSNCGKHKGIICGKCKGFSKAFSTYGKLMGIKCGKVIDFPQVENTGLHMCKM